VNWRKDKLLESRGFVIKCFSVFTLIILLLSCGYFREISEERAYQAKKAKGDILIGAASPWDEIKKSKVLLWEGIEMAVDEINREGGVLGRKLSILKEDDEGSVTTARIIAQRFAENVNMVAVVGHYTSYVCVPVSSVYEFSGLLMISPTATSPKLTQQGFKRIFRNVPNDNDIGKEMANYATRKNYRKILIYYVNNSYGLGLANAFERRMHEIENMEIVDRKPYDPASEKEFRPVLRNWRDHMQFDSIFLAGETPQAGKIISLAKELGIKVPIFGGDGLDTDDLLTVGKKTVEGTVVASFFDPQEPRPRARQFTNKFKERYKVLPDSYAPQGYDAVRLLAQAIQKARTTVPDEIAAALRSTKNWPGAAGDYTFDKNGDVVGRSIVKKIVRGGAFHFLE
jgi:branched-chain amino acid transport system substrate-binding protein